MEQINSIMKQRVPCAVCSKGASHSKYYNVRCCESCKQFFRRVVAKQKDIVCAKLYECDVAPDDRCKGCRLDKCLRLGMDPALVMVEMTEEQRIFNDNLERRRMKLYSEVEMANKLLLVEGQKQQQQQNQQWNLAADWPATTDTKLSMGAEAEKVDEPSLQSPTIPFQLLVGPAAEDVATLRPLLTLLDNQQHIWNSATELPIQYLHRHARLADFFREPVNLLSMPQHFSANPPSFWDKQLCIEQTERLGLFTQEKVEIIVRETMIVLELAKALPFFQLLDSQDQLILIRQVGTAALMLLSCHNSISAQTWTRPNGRTPITQYIESRRFGGDQKIRSLVEKIFCTTVADFKRANIGREEFALMAALLFTNTAGADLSPAGQQLLYEESVRLSGILLRQVQRRHGHFEGSQRFAQLLHVLGSTFTVWLQCWKAGHLHGVVLFARRRAVHFSHDDSRILAQMSTLLCINTIFINTVHSYGLFGLNLLSFLDFLANKLSQKLIIILK